MKAVLLLTHRIPYPPNKGDKIRSYHLLKYLSEKADVYLGTFIDDPNDWQYVDVVKSYCKEVCILPRKKHTQALMGYAKAMVSHQPLSNAMYFQKKMQRWVQRTLNILPIGNVFVFSSNMGQYIKPLQSRYNTIIDFVDVDSLKWEQYSQQQGGMKKWLYQREGSTLAQFEKSLAQKSKINIFVSDNEAQCFKQRSGLKKGVISIGNGVDTQYFSPAIASPSPYHAPEIPITFTGMMDYWPNIDAVTWFAKHVFPIVQEKYPNCRFYIVGGQPTPAVRALAQQKNITVTGRVPDIRPYLQHAVVAVAPLRIARGIQNKVLEALSMDTPIIASPQALEGIQLPKDNAIRVADTAQQWIDSLLRVCQQAINHEIHKSDSHGMIVRHYAWEKQLAALEQYLE